MIKQLLIKKITVLILALTFTSVIVRCTGQDHKNESEPYPSSDTNQSEHKNDPARTDTAHHAR